MRVVNGKEKSLCVWARGGGFRGNERERGCLKESVCILPGHGVPSWGCWGCVGGAVRGGTAESQVVPGRSLGAWDHLAWHRSGACCPSLGWALPLHCSHGRPSPHWSARMSPSGLEPHNTNPRIHTTMNGGIQGAPLM